MGYDRKEALKYARERWFTACDDNRISLIGAPAIDVNQKKRDMGLGPDWSMQFQLDGRGGDQAAFVRGSDSQVFQGWDGLGDCAHYMSRCLTAGGVQGLATDWVPYLNEFLRRLSYTKTLASEAPKERVARIISNNLMKEGDVILYVAPPGGELGGGYVHSAMFVDNSHITCHSIMRFGDDWSAPHSDGYTFTLIHFTTDDGVNTLLEARINGWWEVSWRSETYYYFFSNGKVSYTQQEPSGVAAPAFPTQRGYYFFDPASNKIQICWPHTGTLETLTMAADGQSMSGKWNENEPLTATKRTP